MNCSQKEIKLKSNCSTDNCVDVFNGDQVDTDGDGLGDDCDSVSFALSCESINKYSSRTSMTMESLTSTTTALPSPIEIRWIPILTRLETFVTTAISHLT